MTDQEMHLHLLELEGRIEALERRVAWLEGRHRTDPPSGIAGELSPAVEAADRDTEPRHDWRSE